MDGDKLGFHFTSYVQQQIVDAMESVFRINDYVVKVRGKSKVYHGNLSLVEKLNFDNL